METGGLSAIEIILWVLAANAILILSAYGMVVWLRNKTAQAIAQIDTQIQEHTSRLEDIFHFLEAYTGINQPPFSELINQLHTESSGIQIEIERLRGAAEGFQQQIRTPGVNRLQDIINAPFNKLRSWRHTGSLREQSDAIRARLDEAEKQATQVYELPWELATQCRQAEKDAGELAEFANALQAKGVRGKALEDILTKLKPIRQALSGIPKEFFQADHKTLLEASNLDATIQAYEALSRVRPDLSRHLPEAREWHAHHQKATSEFADLKQQGANLRQSLTQPPEGLVITPLQSRLDQVAQLAADLSLRLGQPEAQLLKPLAREVSQLRKVIQDTEALYKRASQQLNELSLAIQEETTRLEKTAVQMADFEHQEVLPLAWDESGPILNHLRQRLQALGPARQPRTPEQIVQHLKEIETIRAEFKPLAEKQPKVIEQQHALLALLNSSEIHEGAAWLRKTREMLAQASLYDAHNWPKQDSVITLPAELEELNHLQEQLIPTGQPAPVQESGLAERLKQTQQLVAQHKALRPRAENIRARLEKIRALEEECKRKLNGAYKALESIELLSESNDLLAEIALTDIDRLAEEIRQLGNELNQQAQGEVEKKAQKINALAERVTRSLNGWLGRLNAEVAEQGRQLNNWIVQLDTVGVLDDPPIQDARNLLLRDELASALQSGPVPAGPTTPAQRGAAALKGAAARITATDRKQALNDMEVITEIKRKNDFWQDLLVTQAILNEKLGPLMTANHEAVEARNEAREALTEVIQQVPGSKRSWPPSNQAMVTEAQELTPIDHRWDDLKKQHTRIDQAILDLGRLAQQYRLATERAQQVLDRIHQDQDRIQKLEWEIEDLKQRWQTQGQSDANNPVLNAGLQQLMSQTDSRLAFIKQQYMRGAISYEEVVHNLRLLHDDVFAARIPVDERNDIGLINKRGRAEQTNGRTR